MLWFSGFVSDPQAQWSLAGESHDGTRHSIRTEGVTLLRKAKFARTPPGVSLVVLVLLLLVAAGLTALAAIRASNDTPKVVIPPAGSQVAAGTPGSTSVLPVASSDGLKLELNQDGTIAQISDGNRALPKLDTPGGFSMRLVGEEPNLVPNPSLETDENGDQVPDGWSFTKGTTKPQLIDSVAHSGKRSVTVSNDSVATSGAFSTEVAVKPYRNYIAAAWFRSENVLPTSGWFGNPPVRIPDGSPAQIKVEQLTRGGEVISTYYAFGYTNTANWNRQAVGFKTLGETRKLRVTGLLHKGSGKVWFDDLYIGQLISDTVRPITSATTAGADGKLHQHANLADEHLTFDATYTPTKDYIRVDAAVTDTAKRDALDTDKAFQITYTLPVDAVGWMWDDHPRKSREITPDVPFKLNSIQVPDPSRYPFATIHDDKSALTIAMPLNTPRFAKSQYDSRSGLTMTFDLGVSKAAKKLKGKATFTFLLYKSDPAWGIRAATKKYYDIHPESFVRRTDPNREGFWFVRPPLTALDDPKTATDESTAYGLGLNMVSLGTDSTIAHKVWGGDYLKWDNQRNIYTSTYNHHSGFFAPRCLPGQRGCEKLTYEQSLQKLRSDAAKLTENGKNTRLRDESQATLISASRDLNGRLRYTNYQNKFGAFNKYYQNPDPDLSAGMDWSAAAQKHQMEYAIKLAREAGAKLEAIHFDSTSGHRRWGEDYSREHWATADIPLTFSYETGEVTEKMIFAMYEHLEKMADFLHQRGMLLTANFNGNEVNALSFLGADLIDYYGVEQGLEQRVGAVWGVTADSFGLNKRVMAYQKPISTLDTEIGNGEFSLAQMEAKIQRSLFYGIFPGARGQTTKTEGWWSDQGLRKVYARYSPLLEELAVAGWEPITNARSSNTDVWLERFGYASKHNLHLTIRNDSESAQEYTLTVDLNKDGLQSVRTLTAREVIAGETIEVALNSERTQATIDGTIPAGSTRMVRFDTR